MTRKRTHPRSRLVAVTIAVAGLAAAPLTFGPGLVPQANAPVAQTSTSTPGDGTVYYDEDIYGILGTTPEEVRSEEVQVSASTKSGPLQAYEHQMESNNLDGAANALAAVSNRPITEQLVLTVNERLGIESRLIARQVAEVAASRQNPDDITYDTYDESGAVTPGPTPMRETTARLSGDMKSLTTSSRQFGAYEWAMTRGNLDLASTALAEAADEPVTVEYVNEVNNDLGVESTLSSAQVAEATARKQDSID